MGKERAAAIILSALACGAIPMISPAQTLASPNIIPQANVERWALISSPPASAKNLNVTVGVFEGYQLQTTPWLQMTLLLRDDATGAVRKYVLAENTALDGKPIPCSGAYTIGGIRACRSLPGAVAGKTRLAVLYWPNAFPDFPALRGTDTILHVPPQ